MIPPQLALFVAKHSKKIFIVIGILIVIAGVWFAVKMHERTVSKLAESEAARASQEVAHETTLASLENEREAASRWKASAEQYQRTLDEQKRMQAVASEEGRRIAQTLRDHDLDRLARAKPELLERTLNRGTARIIGLLNCSSTASGCEGDRGTSGPDAADPLSSSASPGNFQVGGTGTGVLARPRSGIFLSRASGLRSRS